MHFLLKKQYSCTQLVYNKYIHRERRLTLWIFSISTLKIFYLIIYSNWSIKKNSHFSYFLNVRISTDCVHIVCPRDPDPRSARICGNKWSNPSSSPFSWSPWLGRVSNLSASSEQSPGDRETNEAAGEKSLWHRIVAFLEEAWGGEIDSTNRSRLFRLHRNEGGNRLSTRYQNIAFSTLVYIFLEDLLGSTRILNHGEQ